MYTIVIGSKINKSSKFRRTIERLYKIDGLVLRMSVTCVFLSFGSRVEEPPLSLCFSTLAFDIDMAIGYSAAHNMTVNPIWHEL